MVQKSAAVPKIKSNHLVERQEEHAVDGGVPSLTPVPRIPWVLVGRWDDSMPFGRRESVEEVSVQVASHVGVLPGDIDSTTMKVALFEDLVRH